LASFNRSPINRSRSGGLNVDQDLDHLSITSHDGLPQAAAIRRTSTGQTRVFGASDLKTRRTELLGAAMKDDVATWALRLHAAGARPFPAELAWLDVLDADDRRLCLDELWGALEEVRSGDDRSVFDELLRAWRTTAATLDDPRRREVLLGTSSEDDFVPAARPE
jgi:hypothetical protein